MDSIVRATKSCGIKEFVAKGPWQCILDVIKSRLTGASRASDIAIPQIVRMNGVMNGVVYDWATVLSDRMYEFMTLQHHTFHMLHHAVGLFLEATLTMPLDKMELAPQGKLAPDEPPVFYWKYLDTGGMQVGQKRPRRVIESDREDSGRATTTEDSGSESAESDSTGEEAVVRFAPPLLSSSAKLVPSTAPLTKGVAESEVAGSTTKDQPVGRGQE